MISGSYSLTIIIKTTIISISTKIINKTNF